MFIIILLNVWKMRGTTQGPVWPRLWIKGRVELIAKGGRAQVERSDSPGQFPYDDPDATVAVGPEGNQRSMLTNW